MFIYFTQITDHIILPDRLPTEGEYTTLVQLNDAHGGRNGMHTGYMNLSLIFHVPGIRRGFNLDKSIGPASPRKREI